MASNDASEANTAMEQLHQQPATKNDSPRVPWEIIFQISDILIDEVDDPNVKIRWVVEYNYNTSTKLSVIVDHTGPRGFSPLRKRFNNLRALTQAASGIRRLVHRRFPRVPMLEITGEPAPIQAWVRADIDLFIPTSFGDQKYNTAYAHAFHQSLTMPTPSGFEFLQHIEHVWLIGLGYLSDQSQAALQGLYRLPNLKTFTVDSKDVMPKGFVMHPGKLDIDGDTFPLLAEWHKVSQAFNVIWTPFTRRQVRLYITLRGAKKNPVAEVVSSPNGIYLQCLHPNCTCCDHN
ncbi:hypothetical protein CTA2_9456 [Colletotrichum tanaceti]|uniref:Uncharacterized protein n=1 Tax=Colletotrichum tanaceti TaxID=1306861 RepID=A0A4V6DGE0_9PEZI|nr:hypothetical protein CTA2_9456 [Colletotrichum tanaceti]TKW52416.1 hypothetical protein CTA1_1906 [Colletotrichum tanaceti]